MITQWNDDDDDDEEEEEEEEEEEDKYTKIWNHFWKLSQ